MRTVCVYCGSGFGTDPVFEAAARALGASWPRPASPWSMAAAMSG